MNHTGKKPSAAAAAPLGLNPSAFLSLLATTQPMTSHQVFFLEGCRGATDQRCTTLHLIKISELGGTDVDT